MVVKLPGLGYFLKIDYVGSKIGQGPYTHGEMKDEDKDKAISYRFDFPAEQDRQYERQLMERMKHDPKGLQTQTLTVL